MAFVTTITGQKRFQKAKQALFTPYADDGTLGELTLDLYAVIGDTLAINQEDASTEETPHEFSDSPLLSNVTNGTRTFTCDCIDFQNEVMRILYGATVVDGEVLMPDGYKELNCFVRVVFDNGEIVLPKVQLDSKAVFESLRTGIATGTISGTCLVNEVGVAARVEDGGSMPTSIAADHIAKTDMALISTTNDIFVGNNTDGWKTDTKHA